jgi:hypothetical protein
MALDLLDYTSFKSYFTGEMGHVQRIEKAFIKLIDQVIAEEEIEVFYPKYSKKDHGEEVHQLQSIHIFNRARKLIIFEPRDSEILIIHFEIFDLSGNRNKSIKFDYPLYSSQASNVLTIHLDEVEFAYNSILDTSEVFKASYNEAILKIAKFLSN